jgi:hypothetical protein
MTTALATRADINEIQQVARLLAMSSYFDAKGNSEQAIAQMATKILAGQEMGYGPFASVQGIHVIQGKPVMSANLMAAAVKASARYDFRAKITDDAVTIKFFERIGGNLELLGESTFTKEDAKAAGTQNMQKYGRNMMYARAMSNGVKWYCPDVFYGNAVYTPDELGAAVDADGNYVETTYTTVTEVTPTNGNGNGKAAVSPEDAAAAAIISTWQAPQDAFQWSIDIGACAAMQHAKNAFEKVIKDGFGGKFKTSNAAEVYAAFYHDRLKAAAERAQEPAIDKPLDVSDVTEAEGAALFA